MIVRTVGDFLSLVRQQSLDPDMPLGLELPNGTFSPTFPVVLRREADGQGGSRPAALAVMVMDSQTKAGQ